MTRPSSPLALAVLLTMLASAPFLAQAAGAGADALPERPWWLALLSVLDSAAIVAGAVALLGGGHARLTGSRTKVGGRRPGWTATGGAVLLGVGGLGHALLPGWPPRGPEVITDRAFSSARMPAIDLDLPLGWHLTHGNAEGVADVVTATLPSDGGPAAAVLIIQSSVLDESVDLAALGGKLVAGFAQNGTPVGPPADAQIDGRKAVVLNGARDDGTRMTIWIVKRADRFVSQLYCFGPPNKQEACAPAIARLHWHPPGAL
jgi:hypothetical protein